MRTVYKYQLSYCSEGVTLSLHTMARELRGAIQGKVPCLWVELDTEQEPLYPRTYKLFGIGHEIPKDAKRVGSFDDAPFIWHLYEVQ